MKIDIPTICNDGAGVSVFSQRTITLAGSTARQLSKQIAAENFRLRHSNSEYSSDWHVAGDPTLLIILAGTLEIELRNGESKRFSSGEMFIAEDFLTPEVNFDDTRHGHRARVVGNRALSAMHLKLSHRNAG